MTTTLSISRRTSLALIRIYHIEYLAFFITLLLLCASASVNAQAVGTLLEGQAYIDECKEKGVPIPPDWGSNDKWEYVGTLSDDQEFISVGLEARVFKYESIDTPGSCIALPRVNLDSDQIALLGIICLGIETSNACFWDNQNSLGESFSIPVRKSVPLSDFAGGAALFGGSGGECTQCHLGENSYVLHPRTPLGFPLLGNLKVRPKEWYKPLVHPQWSQNKGPTDILKNVDSKRECTGCHRSQDDGGRFPELDSNLQYCGTVLAQAIKRTMPPRNPGDKRYEKHANKLLEECGISPAPVVGAAPAAAPLSPEDPIAYIAHGAFFNKYGEQIEVTEEFLDTAQSFYLTELNGAAAPAQQNDFEALKGRLPDADGGDGQGTLVANSALLDWLSVRTDPSPDTIGKLSLIRSTLKNNLSEVDSGLEFEPSEELLEFIESEDVLKQWHRK